MLCKTLSQNRRIFLVLAIFTFILLNISPALAIDYETAYDSVYDLYGILGDGTNRTGAYNITFQVRSCDDASCDTETFVGPDNTSTSYFENATYNDLNTTLTPDNQYFQYLAFFYTEDQNYTPMLFNVTVGYTKNIYPTNVTLNIGNDSDVEWNQTGVFDYQITIDDTNTTPLFSSELNDVLAGECSCSGCEFNTTDSTCKIPFALGSDTEGKINISDINISYDLMSLNITCVDQSSNPIETALVEIFTPTGNSTAWKSAYTDSNGTASFTTIIEKTYDIKSSKTSYASNTENTNVGPNGTYTLNMTALIDYVRVYLYDYNNNPISGKTVDLYLANNATVYQTNTTDANGYTEFFVDVIDYDLKIDPTGWNRLYEDISLPYTKTLYGLLANVSNQNNQAVNNAQVWVYESATTTSHNGNTNSSGMVEFGLENQSYDISTFNQGVFSRLLRQNVPGTANIELDLTLTSYLDEINTTIYTINNTLWDVHNNLTDINISLSNQISNVQDNVTWIKDNTATSEELQSNTTETFSRLTEINTTLNENITTTLTEINTTLSTLDLFSISSLIVGSPRYANEEALIEATFTAQNSSYVEPDTINITIYDRNDNIWTTATKADFTEGSDHIWTYSKSISASPTTGMYTVHMLSSYQGISASKSTQFRIATGGPYQIYLECPLSSYVGQNLVCSVILQDEGEVATESTSTVWVDTNNNGAWDSGEPQSSFSKQTVPLQNVTQSVSINVPNTHATGLFVVRVDTSYANSAQPNSAASDSVSFNLAPVVSLSEVSARGGAVIPTIEVKEKEGKIEITDYPKRIEIIKIESLEKTFGIKNIGKGNLSNVELIISGLPLDTYKILPKKYNLILPGETKIFLITFKADIEEKEYKIKFIVISEEGSEEVSSVLIVKAKELIEKEEEKAPTAITTPPYIVWLLIVLGILTYLGIKKKEIIKELFKNLRETKEKITTSKLLNTKNIIIVVLALIVLISIFIPLKDLPSKIINILSAVKLPSITLNWWFVLGSLIVLFLAGIFVVLIHILKELRRDERKTKEKKTETKSSHQDKQNLQSSEFNVKPTLKGELEKMQELDKSTSNEIRTNVYKMLEENGIDVGSPKLPQKVESQKTEQAEPEIQTKRVTPINKQDMLDKLKEVYK